MMSNHEMQIKLPTAASFLLEKIRGEERGEGT